MIHSLVLAAAIAGSGFKARKAPARGISAGGYLTSILLSCYSDVFAAGMIAAGGMYEAASDAATDFGAAMKGARTIPPPPAATRIAAPAVHPRRVPVLVFHGSDAVVRRRRDILLGRCERPDETAIM